MSSGPNCSSTGRAAPGVALSVTMMSAMGWASWQTCCHTPSASNMRRAAAVMAEARPSKLLLAKPRGILDVDDDDVERALHMASAQRQGRSQSIEGRANDDDVVRVWS